MRALAPACKVPKRRGICDTRRAAVSYGGVRDAVVLGTRDAIAGFMVMKYAFCNEMCGEQPFPEAFATMRSLGYTGVEFAPFTLAPPTDAFDARDVPAERRHDCRV